MGSKNNCELNISKVLILSFGIIFVFFSILYNKILIVFFNFRSPLRTAVVESIKSVRICFFTMGFILIFISGLINRISWLKDFMKKDLFAKILLSFLIIFFLISVLELFPRPFAIRDAETTIFIKDNELGWRLKPNSEDIWGKRCVRINKKGLRGPPLDYIKSNDVIRILYLGDSVTFGYRLANYNQSFVYIIENILEKNFRYNIESINAGVGGYSPWQEYIYLSKEGIKYSPDLVIISFVLNDITEKFTLKRFGGNSEGYQLSHVAINSGIMYLVGKISSKLEFGNNVKGDAIKKENLRVKTLIDSTNHSDVQHALKLTLYNLSKIFNFCKNKNIPIVLVIFPYSFQFDDIYSLSMPQTILVQYASQNNVPVIDLLPLLYKKMDKDKDKIKNYFLDTNHLSYLGNKKVAEIIIDFILEMDLFQH